MVHSVKIYSIFYLLCTAVIVIGHLTEDIAELLHQLSATKNHQKNLAFQYKKVAATISAVKEYSAEIKHIYCHSIVLNQLPAATDQQVNVIRHIWKSVADNKENGLQKRLTL